MPFHFNLQKVLDFRIQKEEEAKVALARAEAQVREGEEILAKLKDEYKKAEAVSFGKIMQSGERWLQDQYIKGLKSDISQAALQLRFYRQIAEEARKALAARAMERKLLDKLKEKQKIQFIKAEQKQEQNFNDEIATIRYKAPAIEAGEGSDSAGLS